MNIIDSLNVPFSAFKSMNLDCLQIHCFMLSPLSFTVLSMSEHVYEYVYMCMSMVMSADFGVGTLKQSLTYGCFLFEEQ